MTKIDYTGQEVVWELSGRGRGSQQSGEVAMHIPVGTTNEDALKTLSSLLPDLKIRPKYCRFDKATHKTHRVFVLVKQDTKRSIPVFWIYAPNVAEITLV